MSTTVKSVVFLALAFTISWVIVGAGWAMGWHNSQQSAVFTLAAAVFEPSFAPGFDAHALGRDVMAAGTRSFLASQTASDA